MKKTFKALQTFSTNSIVMALSFGLVCGPYALADVPPIPPTPPAQQQGEALTKGAVVAPPAPVRPAPADPEPAVRQAPTAQAHDARGVVQQVVEDVEKAPVAAMIPFYDYQNCNGVVADAHNYCAKGANFRLLGGRMDTGRDGIINACEDSQETNIAKAKSYRARARKSHGKAEDALEQRIKDIDKEIKNLEKINASDNAMPADQVALEAKRKHRADLDAQYKDTFQHIGVAQDHYEMCRQHAYAAFNEGVKILGFYHGSQHAYVKNSGACVAEFERVGGQFFTPSSFPAPADIGSWHRKIRFEYNRQLETTQEAFNIYQECAAEQAGGLHQPAESLKKAMKQEKIKKILLGVGITAGVLAILCFVFKLGPCKKDENQDKDKKKKKKKKNPKPAPHHPEPTPTPTPTGTEIIDPRGPRTSNSDPAGAATGGGNRNTQSGAATGASGGASRTTGSGQTSGASGSAPRGTGSGTTGGADGAGVRGTRSGQTGGAGGRDTGSTVRPPVGR